MPSTRYDWRALRLEYIARRLRGEALTISAFAREKGPSRAAMSRQLSGAESEIAERTSRVEEATLQRAEIDQIARRIDLLQTLDELKPGVYPMLRAWATNMSRVARRYLDEMARTGRPVKNQKEFLDAINPKEMKQILDIFEKISVSGAGLPREHVVMHDDVHEDLRASRRQMQELQQTGTEISEWLKQRRATKDRKGGKVKS